MNLDFKKINTSDFFKYVDEATINNPHFNIVQFEKLRYDAGEFFCAFNEGKLAAAAFIVFNRFKMREAGINEIQALLKGAGKLLLNKILETYPKLWLMAEPGNPKLIEYYRQFNLTEVVIEDTIYGCDVSMFCQGLDVDKFKEVTEEYYTKINLTNEI